MDRPPEVDHASLAPLAFRLVPLLAFGCRVGVEHPLHLVFSCHQPCLVSRGGS